MKITLTFVVGIIILLLPQKYMAQENRSQVSINNFNTELREQSLNSVPCNPNTFWLLNEDPINPGQFNIREYLLNNGSIIPTNYILYNVPNENLAYCNLLGLSNSGTFFNLDTYATNNILRFSGTNWVNLQIAPINIDYFNPGGNKNTLAFQGRDFTLYPKYIDVFDGTSVNQIFYTGNKHSIIGADIAVDSLERIWFFISPDTNFFTPTSLLVISKTGVLLHSYFVNLTPQNFDFLNVYGMFILNNTLYIGCGFQNATCPQTIIPLIISNDTVFMGTPISFIAPTNRLDLESCNQGTLTSISEVPESLKELSVYPNPAENQFTVHLPYGSNRNAQLTIYNLQGKLIETKKASDTTPINCASWARGIYFVSLVEEGKVKVTKKVVVMP